MTTVTTLGEFEGLFGSHLAYAPDGHRWALGDSRAVQFGTDDDREAAIATPGPIHHLAFSQDGSRLLACPEVYQIEQRSWADVPDLSEAFASGLDMPPSPDQLGIAAGAFAVDGAEMVVVTRFQPSRELGVEDDYAGPLERLLLIGSGGSLRSELHAGDDELRAVAVGNRYVAAGGVTVLLWDRESHERSEALPYHRYVVRDLAFSADGTSLAAAASDGDVSLWNAATSGLEAAWRAHEGDAYAVAVGPDREIVATGGQDGALRLWSPAGELLHEVLLDGWVEAIAFNAAGTRVAATARSTPPRLVVYGLD